MTTFMIGAVRNALILIRGSIVLFGLVTSARLAQKR